MINFQEMFLFSSRRKVTFKTASFSEKGIFKAISITKGIFKATSVRKTIFESTSIKKTFSNQKACEKIKKASERNDGNIYCKCYCNSFQKLNLFPNLLEMQQHQEA